MVLAVGSPAGSTETALALERAGDDAGALREAEAACFTDPFSALAHLEAARLGLKLGQDVYSVDRHVRAALKLAPDNPRAFYLEGLVRQEQGRPEEARHAFEQAITLKPDYAEAHGRLGTLYAQAKDWPQAEAQLRWLLQKDPHSTSASLELARALESEQKLREAELTLVALHQAQPESALVTHRLADFYARTGHPERAARLNPAKASRLRPLLPSKR